MNVKVNGEVLDTYTIHLKARHLSSATIRQYTTWPRLLAADCGPLLGLQGRDLEAWIGRQEWSAWTHIKAIGALKGFYAWAVDDGLLEVSPAAGLKAATAPRVCPDPCPEDVYWRVLLEASGARYWRLRLAAETGLRRAELARVTSDDVVPLADGPNLHVVGKGGVQRWVPLRNDLADWLALQRGPVFPARAGGCQSPDSVGKWYKQALGKHAHSLRHRFACLAYDEDHDIVTLADMMGHASVETTQRYVAVTGAARRRTAAGAWGLNEAA